MTFDFESGSEMNLLLGLRGQEGEKKICFWLIWYREEVASQIKQTGYSELQSWCKNCIYVTCVMVDSHFKPWEGSACHFKVLSQIIAFLFLPPPNLTSCLGVSRLRLEIISLE